MALASSEGLRPTSSLKYSVLRKGRAGEARRRPGAESFAAHSGAHRPIPATSFSSGSYGPRR